MYSSCVNNPSSTSNSFQIFIQQEKKIIKSQELEVEEQ